MFWGKDKNVSRTVRPHILSLTLGSLKPFLMVSLLRACLLRPFNSLGLPRRLVSLETLFL